MALVFFLPLLIASGGNAGAQRPTLVVVRALATGDVKPSEWALILLRDAAVAAAVGAAMALAVSMVGVFRGGPDWR